MSTKSKQQRAFTLAEVVLSTAVMSVLMGGLTTAVMLAGRAVPTGESTAGATIKGYNGLEQLEVELAVAQAIIAKTPTSVEFTVADRDGDLLPETIRYDWSGAAGSSLTRKYNLLDPVDVTIDVGDFALTYDVTAYSRPVPPVDTKSGEVLLASHAAAAWLYTARVASTKWVAQYFQPVLPAEAVSWSVTRVMFRAQTVGPANGVSFVQIRSAVAGNLPDTTVIEQRSMLEASLSPSLMWEQFSYASVSGIAPTQGLCLVLQHVSGSGNGSATIEYSSSGVVVPQDKMVTTKDSGSSWDAYPSDRMIYKVYGTITSRTAATMASGFVLNGVRARLRVGEDASSLIETRVRMLNTPEVVGP